MITPQKRVLKNGTRVILIPNQNTEAAAVLVLFAVGSRHETNHMAGAAHFIEHLMFKGTKKRPSNLDISQTLDGVGADYNAFTWRDCTGYYVKLEAEKLPMAAEMLGDILNNSLLRDSDIDAERGVIMEEIRMYQDNPMMLVDSVMEEELYRGAPLGRQIAGSIETVGRMHRKDLKAFRDAYYTPERTVVAFAGKFDEESAIRLAEAHFGKRHPVGGGRDFQKFDVKKAGFRAPHVHVINRETEQVQLAMGFPSYQYGHKKLATTSLLNVILGGTMSSRLFLEVRQKRGLAYFIHSSINVYQDVGNLAIQAGIAKGSVNDAVKVIIDELKKIKSKPVSEIELQRAKDYVKGKMALHLEESSELAEWFARQEVLENRMSRPEEKLKRIMAVTAEDIQSAARDIFRPSRLTMAIIGPGIETDRLKKTAEKL